MALAARLGTWQLAAASTAVFGAVTLSSAAVFRTCFAALLARAREKDAKDIEWKLACRVSAVLHAVGVCYLGIRRLATPGLKWAWLGANTRTDVTILAHSFGFFTQVCLQCHSRCIRALQHHRPWTTRHRYA